MSFHYMDFRTYSHATENEFNVESALRFVSGTDRIEFRKTKGYHGNPIIIMEAEIKKSRDVKDFFTRLSQANLIEKIIHELKDRIDENCNFYLRFDKQSAFFQKYELVRHDNVISVSGKIKCFPTNEKTFSKKSKKSFRVYGKYNFPYNKRNAIKTVKVFLENL